jgi:hypothetical protein
LGINLTEGKYIIIPCTENTSYAGNFSVNVWCTGEGDTNKKSKISLKQLPLENGWNTKTFQVQLLRFSFNGSRVPGKRNQQGEGILVEPNGD